MDAQAANLMLTVGISDSLLWPVWIGLFFLVPALVVAALVYGPMRSRRTDEPICGRCGHPVKGVSSVKCPECDSDLRDVGIRRPRGGMVFALLIAGSLGLIAGGAYLFAAVPNLMPTAGIPNLAAWAIRIVLFGAIPAAAVAALVYQPMRANSTDEPVCGRCGYKVKGAASLKCPECDSDLREVGIRRPRGGMVFALLVAATLGVVVGLVYFGADCFLSKVQSAANSVPQQSVPQQSGPKGHPEDRKPDPGLSP